MTATSQALPVRDAHASRRSDVRAGDLYAILGVNVALILGMWVRHGGLDLLSSPGGILTALGQLAALYGTFGALLQLVLMARSPWLMEVFGPDRLNWAHRWLGFATVWLIVGHGVFTTIGWAVSSRQAVLAELWSMVTTLEFVLMSVVSLGLFIAVAVTSVRAARRALSYETWHGIHLYAYLAIALGFGHQLVVGSDFIDDPVARIYWATLYGITAALVVAFRFGMPLMVTLRHRFRVANVVREGPGVASIYLSGRGLDAFPIRAGQYLNLRFLGHPGWWRGHPFSISAQPNGQWLRLTVKDLGDDSFRYLSVPIGTPVLVEGPYGNMTADRAERPKVLLLAGGIGVTPLRALLEEFSTARRQVILLYRASEPNDLVFRNELDVLARRPGVTVHYLVGRRGSREMPYDPLAPKAIRRLVPDIRERDVYICGPRGLMHGIRRSVAALGVPSAHVHLEHFHT